MVLAGSVSPSSALYQLSKVILLPEYKGVRGWSLVLLRVVDYHLENTGVETTISLTLLYIVIEGEISKRPSVLHFARNRIKIVSMLLHTLHCL